MDYTLALFTSTNSPQSGLDDVRLPLYHALLELGHNVQLCHQSIYPDSQNIIFGLHDRPDIPLHRLPPDSIIYNLEQITPRSRAMTPAYLKALAKFKVWDYSLRNIERLKQSFGVGDVTHVPLGYVPQMTVINPDYPKDIDVLLYGCPNSRRKAVIDALRAHGVNALLACHVFGKLRDGLIARSHLVLNVHFYYPGILEVVRLSYLLANRVPVISELNADTEAPDGYEAACIYSPYEKLTKTVIAVLADKQALRRQGVRGYEIFAATKYADILREVLSRPDCT